MARRRTQTAEFNTLRGTNFKEAVIYSQTDANIIDPGFWSSLTNFSFSRSVFPPSVANVNATLMGIAGTFDNFWFSGDVPTSGTGERFTLVKNGVNQSLEVFVPAGQQQGNDLIHSFDVAPGDLVAIFADGANANVWSAMAMSLRFTPM